MIPNLYRAIQYILPFSVQRKLLMLSPGFLPFLLCGFLAAVSRALASHGFSHCDLRLFVNKRMLLCLVWFSVYDTRSVRGYSPHPLSLFNITIPHSKMDAAEQRAVANSLRSPLTPEQLFQRRGAMFARLRMEAQLYNLRASAIRPLLLWCLRFAVCEWCQ